MTRLLTAEGREAIALTTGAVQAQFPGFVFRLAGPVDASRPGTLRLGACPAGKEAPIVGFDFAVTDAVSQLQTVLGLIAKGPDA